MVDMATMLAGVMPQQPAPGSGTGSTAPREGEGGFGSLLEKIQQGGKQPGRLTPGREAAKTEQPGEETPADLLLGMLATPETAPQLIADTVASLLPIVPMVSAPDVQVLEMAAVLPEILLETAGEDSLAGFDGNVEPDTRQAGDSLGAETLPAQPQNLETRAVDISAEQAGTGEDISTRLQPQAADAGKAAQETVMPLKQAAEAKSSMAEMDTAPAGPQAANAVWQAPGEVAAVKAESAPINTGAPDFGEQFAQAVVQKGETGLQQFDIALYPKQLGKVTVNVQIEAGRAVLSFVCENAKAQAVLNAHAGEIGQLVEQSTGRPADIQLPQGGQDAGQQQDFEGHNKQNQEGQKRQKHAPLEVEFFIDQLKSSLLAGG